MFLMVLDAAFTVLFYDLVIRVGGFSAACNRIKRLRVRHIRQGAGSLPDICKAVGIIECVYYKRVRCLLRSAALVSLLRRRGFCADLVIAARAAPFVSHAWVEVDDCVVNDLPGYKQRLSELARF